MYEGLVCLQFSYTVVWFELVAQIFLKNVICKNTVASNDFAKSLKSNFMLNWF